MWGEVIRSLEEPKVAEDEEKLSTKALEELGKKRLDCQNLFLDKAWAFAEWAPLKSWQGMEGNIMDLNALGRQLGELHGRWLGALKSGEAETSVELPGGWSKAVAEYRELGKRLEEGVRVACPWPGLRKAMGEGLRA